MDYCGPAGIPHSRFLTWDKDDRDKALWWQIHRAQACPSCGTRPEEWDPDQGGDDFAYTFRIRSCRGCETLAGGRKQIPDGKQDVAHVTLVPNPELRTPGG